MFTLTLDQYKDLSLIFYRANLIREPASASPAGQDSTPTARHPSSLWEYQREPIQAQPSLSDVAIQEMKFHFPSAEPGTGFNDSLLVR